MHTPDSQVVMRRILAMLSETSVHAGTGAQLGAVDLPIQRERHTEWPTIYGTGLKGVLRDEADRTVWDKEKVAAVFGPETEKGEGGSERDRHAGALAISDARLLLFPVRTLGYPFAWITCPLAVARFRRDAAHAGIDNVPEISEQPTADQIVVPPTWSGCDKGVLIEEFSYAAAKSSNLEEFGKWLNANLLPAGTAYAYWRDLVARALALVSDEDFRDFVRHGTEVVTRVRLEDGKKTVASGALWTEEHLPSDTLLYSFIAAWRPSRNGEGLPSDAAGVLAELSKLLVARPVVQVGGKETVGHGFVALRLTGGNHA
jgi:CRISPR-associated protein Cmr4